MSQSSVCNVPFLYLAKDGNAKRYFDESDIGVWPITSTLLIGRENADITISLPGLSRHHAKVHSGKFGFSIYDLGSKNGTAVNGTMLTKDPHPLSHGDRILLAGIVELCFHDPDATPIGPRLGKLRGLWIDSQTKDVWIDAEKLLPPLSTQQQNLLELLVEADGRLVSKTELIEQLWTHRTVDTISRDAVDSLIKRLRRRLANIEHGDPVLEVQRGHGIRLRREREATTG